MEIEHAKLKKVKGLIETAMKTNVAKSKLRETLRKKAEAELDAFKDSYAEVLKYYEKAGEENAEVWQQANGIAEKVLIKDHSFMARVNDMVAINKKLLLDGQYDDLDKAIDALEDWEVTNAKTDVPKKAIKHLEQATDVLSAQQAEIEKIGEEHTKGYAEVVKAFFPVEDAEKEIKDLLGFCGRKKCVCV
jgi:hypothetical protein